MHRLVEHNEQRVIRGNSFLAVGWMAENGLWGNTVLKDHGHLAIPDAVGAIESLEQKSVVP